MTAMIEYKVQELVQELTAYELVVKNNQLQFEGFVNGVAKVAMAKNIQSSKDFYVFARTDGERWRYLIIYRQQDVGSFSSKEMYIPSLEAVLKHCW